MVIDIPSLNTFTPNNFSGFSKKEKCIFWDSLLEEVKGKFDFLEKNKDFDPLLFLLNREIEKLSKDKQSVPLVNPVVTTIPTSVVNPFINTVQGQSNQSLRIMANRHAPLNLPVDLNAMPDNYHQKIKPFGVVGDFSAQQHVDWFKYFCDLTEIDEEDVHMRLFAQSL